MKKHIVVINGTGGCGKTSFAEFCSKYANVQNVSSVAKVKEIAKFKEQFKDLIEEEHVDLNEE